MYNSPRNRKVLSGNSSQSPEMDGFYKGGNFFQKGGFEKRQVCMCCVHYQFQKVILKGPRATEGPFPLPLSEEGELEFSPDLEQGQGES